MQGYSMTYDRSAWGTQGFRSESRFGAGARVLLAIGASLLAASAVAQDFTIEEVVVTATKRSASIQDVPFSINAQT